MMIEFIKRIYNNDLSYEVGKDDISKIELTEHGDEKKPIYKITYEHGYPLYVGLLEHDIEYSEGEENEQMR